MVDSTNSPPEWQVLSAAPQNICERARRLEAAIATDKGLLQETLAHGLMNLKMQRPDLFTLSGPEQIAMLLKAFLK